MKVSRWYIFWVEGLTLRTGEKIQSVSGGRCTYTTMMGEALRVKESDLEVFEGLLADQGVTYTRHLTSYCPAGRGYKRS